MTPQAVSSRSPASGATSASPVVMIVDDDPSVREGLAELMLSAGYNPMTFASTHELLDSEFLNRPGCLVLDVRMPGASGLDLQQQLARSGNPKPVIFLTGHGDIPMSVQAMKAGAIDFLTKPVRDQTLLDAVAAAITRDAAQLAQADATQRNVERMKTLTPREREVIAAAAHGRLNKQIAYDLGISEVTVKLHRSNAMRKLQLSSVGALVRLWESLPDVARS